MERLENLKEQDLQQMQAPKPRRYIAGDEFRTHLANERTFLAWCRTSISLIIFGFVSERLNLFIQFDAPHNNPSSLPTGLHAISICSIILAGMIVVISGYRFLSVRRMIHDHTISVSVFPVVMVVLSMVAIIIMVIGLIIH
jgi:putative membrane protein